MVGETETVCDDGFRRIRNDIIFGHWQPDQKLRLEALKERYGVSISTLREILSRLSSEGLVVAEGRRGFEVAPVSATDLREWPNSASCWGVTPSRSHSNAAKRNGKAGFYQHIKNSQWSNSVWDHQNAKMLFGIAMTNNLSRLIPNGGSTAFMVAHRRAFERCFRFPVIWAIVAPRTDQKHRQVMQSALDRKSKKRRQFWSCTSKLLCDAIAGAKIR